MKFPIPRILILRNLAASGRARQASATSLPVSGSRHLSRSKAQSAPAGALTVAPITTFRINTYGSAASVDSKAVTETLSLLDATLRKNRGRGAVMVNQTPDEGCLS